MYDDPAESGPDLELLSPAGDMECVHAAIENGADAVYFGLQDGFNARDRAKNIVFRQLDDVMTLLRGRGVRGYVTLNTLAFPAELPQAERLVRGLAERGVDAVLVQDLGVARLIREVCPELSIHASTQMTVTSAESLRFAESLGAERVVLARELSVDDIRRIHDQTQLVLEAFVHGALCVAYSGQCLTSESLGGRSANRGQCAQACRLPYELVCDGRDVDLGQVKYLLSPQDLAAYELIPQLIDAGVTSFKIEGRLKTPEYVANITRHYRQALDAAAAGREHVVTARQVEEMELSFSRGFSPGWLAGDDHKRLVPGLSSAKRGVRLGSVVAVRGSRIEVKLCAEVKAGDGVVFAGDRELEEQQGGRVFEVFAKNQRRKAAGAGERVELTFGRGKIDAEELYPGQVIWKTDDPELTKRLRQSFQRATPIRRVAIHLHVRARVGEPLSVHATAENGARCLVESDAPLEAARKHAATVELFRDQLGRLGRSCYELGRLTAEISGPPMTPLSVLGTIRRSMIEQLDGFARTPPQRVLGATDALSRLRRQDLEAATAQLAQPASTPRLRLLCRTQKQLQAALDTRVDGVFLDFEDIRQYGEAVGHVRKAGISVYLATPRIQRPGELGVFRALLRHQPDGILVRNLGGVLFFAEQSIPFVADHTLNAANDLTVALLHRRGARRVTASFDLNREQLADLAAVAPPTLLEVVIHQHMPLFHMEHCVFCALLSPGTNKTNCGRPCDRHRVKLRDRVGLEHPLTADVGCRNTLFNATPQSAAEAVPALLAAGVRDMRIDLVDEDGDAARQTIGLYQKLLAGQVSGQQVWKRLKALNRVGITRGTMEAQRDPLAVL